MDDLGDSTCGAGRRDATRIPCGQRVYHREDAASFPGLGARFGAGPSSEALEVGSDTRCRFRVRSRSATTEQKLVRAALGGLGRRGSAVRPGLAACTDCQLVLPGRLGTYCGEGTQASAAFCHRGGYYNRGAWKRPVMWRDGSNLFFFVEATTLCKHYTSRYRPQKDGTGAKKI